MATSVAYKFPNCGVPLSSLPGRDKVICEFCGTEFTVKQIEEMFTNTNLKYKFGNRHFWVEGYYVSTVGLNEATIKKYIREQEKQDTMLDKLSVKEYEDPFKG